MGKITDRLLQWWKTADRGQKVVTLGGAGVLLLVLVAVFVFATRPRYETLFANLTEQEQSSVVTDLQGMGFDVKYDRVGVVEVASSEKAMARIKLAAANKLPRAQGQWGLGDLNTMPFGITPNVEQQRIKAITEGEISKSIEAMDGIDNARIHLTIPEKSAFTDEKMPVTAAVALTTSADATLSVAQGRAIGLLVKNAVDGLEIKNVVVVDQHLRTIYNGEDEKGDGVNGATKKTDLDEEVSRKRQRELQMVLDTAFGAGAAVVTVHADVDMDSSKITVDQKTPSAKPASVETTNEKVNAAPTAAGGLAGTEAQSKALTTGKSGADSKGGYDAKTENSQYLENDRQEQTEKATGSIKAMAINVVIDTSRPSVSKEKVQRIVAGDMANMAKLNAKTYEVDAGQPYSVTVTDVPFDKTAEVAAKKEAVAAASQQKIQQILSILPIAALLLVAAIVVKQIAKFAKAQGAQQMALTSEGVSVPLSGQTALPTSDATNAELSHLLAELDGSGLSRSNAFHRMEEDPLEVEDIKNRVHMPLEQLKKMAVERPAVVAQLIKSMLLEERK